jgi:putative oxidoreductase
MSIVRGFLALAGRIILVSIFLLSGILHAIPPHYQEAIVMMRSNNVPYPEYLLPGGLVFLVVGGLSVLLGYKARFGAFLLLVFLVVTTYYFHNFWDKTTPFESRNEMAHFMKNVSLAGAMVFIVAVGAGPWSMDARSTDTTA